MVVLSFCDWADNRNEPVVFRLVVYVFKVVGGVQSDTALLFGQIQLPNVVNRKVLIPILRCSNDSKIEEKKVSKQ